MEESPKERRPEHALAIIALDRRPTRCDVHVKRKELAPLNGTWVPPESISPLQHPKNQRCASTPRFPPRERSFGFSVGFLSPWEETNGGHARARTRAPNPRVPFDRSVFIRVSTRFTRGQRAVYAPLDPTRARFRATCSSDSCSRCFQRGTEIARSRGSARGTPPALDRPRARTFGRAAHARETRLTPHVPPIDHDDDGFISQLLPRRPRPRARPVRPVSNSPFRAELCAPSVDGVFLSGSA